MARVRAGGTTSDFVYTTIAGGLIRTQSATLTIWSAESGGVQLTDLLLDGVPVTTIPVAADGQVPDFDLPDGVFNAWASADGGTTRVKLSLPSEDAQFASAVDDPGSATRAALSATYAPLANPKKHAPAFGLYFIEAEGAVSDGVVDCSRAIQATHDVCRLGGTIVIPPGRWRCASTITITKAVKFDCGPGGVEVGETTGTVLLFEAGINGVVVDIPQGAGGVEFGPLKLRSKALGAVGPGVGLLVKNGRVRAPAGLTVEYFGSHGVHLNGDSASGGTGGQVNLCYMAAVRCYGNGGDGLHINGQDSNEHTIVGINLVANKGWGINNNSASNQFYGVHADQQYHSAPGAIRDNGNSNAYHDVYSEAGVKVLLDTNSNFATLSISQYARPALDDQSTSKSAAIFDTQYGHEKQINLYSRSSGTRFAWRAGQQAADIVDWRYEGNTGAGTAHSAKVFMDYNRATDQFRMLTTLLCDAAVQPIGAKAGLIDLGANTVRWRDIYLSGMARLNGALPVFEVTNKPAAPTAANASTVDSTYGAEEAAVINNLRTRVGELEAALRSLGLIT